MDPRSLAHAAQLLDQADAVIVAAGAGIGVDSGLPDFRGDTGFWNAYPALAAAGLRFAEIACPASFASDPELAWGFYGHRLELYRRTVPHAGFDILRRWTERAPAGGFVFTSNVDGQFQRAGLAAGRIAECHGSIHWLQCTRPCSDTLWPADELVVEIDAAACRWRAPLPRCPRCGAGARPNILMFGDGAWLPGRSAAQLDALAGWLQGVRRPVVVEIGAGTAVPSVRHFTHQLLHEHDGRLIRLNPRESRVPGALHVGLAAGALDGLLALDAALAAG
ncbi:NAD-dependent deacetylase [Rubrivivax gelatinosus]|nr:NAD-dependent deacetylase [Rubrivivax gelatinosus]